LADGLHVLLGGHSASFVFILILGLAWQCYGGGSGFNTVVVVNQSSSNSVEVGNHYCERRQIPPENVLRISWTGGNIAWTNTDFESVLLGPLLDLIANRHLDQICYVVLSMDIPFQTIFDGVVNSTTSALFYAPKTETGPDWVSVTNSYSSSESAFVFNAPASARGYSFLATMITAGSVSQAKLLIDQGVTADGSFPLQRVLLEKSPDPLRNFRYWTFDNAIFNALLCRTLSIARTNCNSPFGQTNLLGLQTGLYQFSISSNSFIPGAMADSLTSFGGIIFGPNDHTTLLAFINAGASGSYGTVTEPSPMLEKFPAPRNYFYQARGFTIAESYYQSIDEPYEGLIVAEPLSSPFRRSALGNWTGISSNTVLSGTQPLSVHWAAADLQHPLQQVDLFVDGRFLRTMTNADPIAGNVITATLNGYPVSYQVPTNVSISMIASGLATSINALALPGAPGVSALAYGDRIELHAPTNVAGPFFYTDHAILGQPTRFFRTVFLPLPSTPVLNALGRDPNGTFRLHVDPADTTPYRIEASTNLVDWILLADDLAGPLDFSDPAAAGIPARFYRFAAGPRAEVRPTIAGLGFDRPGSFKVHVENAGAATCLIEASTNLLQWTPVATNAAPGGFDFSDFNARNFTARFYRASAMPQTVFPPRTAFYGQTAAGDSIIQIASASRPYILQCSTDLVHWAAVFTNTAPGRFQVSTASSRDANAPQNVSLYASRGTFMNSPALGIRKVRLYGTINVGTSLQVVFIKTNGANITIGLTNQSYSASIFNLAQNLVSAINACPDLQGPDGVEAIDLAQGWFGSGLFNLRARSPGLEAAAMRVVFNPSTGLLSNPSADFALDQNLSDLQPRNHLYVAAGVTNLSVHLPLDTTQLSDGWHDLTAVAYEGTSVRTQTRVSIPLVIANSPLKANLAFTDLLSTNPITTSTCQLVVTANATNVSAIRLFSTGGVLDTVSNQNSATFTVNGAFLGAGLHPFYAIVETPQGLSFRTQKAFVRFVNPP
jgi:uncharacterized protein (TIGR03790 family)